MAHAASGRCGQSGNEPDHRFLTALFGFIDQELRCVLFRAATDFADHDDRFGFIVGEEQLEHVDEVGAVNRIAADADRGGLAKPFGGGLEHRFIS